ncbi:MAG: hypothetical protein AAFY36_04950 [Bacteroidota bacterium]
MTASVVTPRFFRLFFSLKRREKKGFQQFLGSPYHNRREDAGFLVNLLSTYNSHEEVPEKSSLWAQVFGPECGFNDQSWRLLLSYLTKQLERFLAVEALLADEFDVKMKVASVLEGRSSNQLQEKLLKESAKLLERDEVRNAEYWLKAFQYQESYYRQAFSRQPEKDDQFSLLSASADRAFLSFKLRQLMWLLNHEQVYQWGYEPTLFDRFILSLSEDDIEAIPALRLYFYGIQVLQNPDSEEAFQRFSESLFNEASHLPVSEARDLYLLAINFGVRRVNSGQRAYFERVMELYRSGLENAYLLRKGRLSRFTYHNIVSTALQVNDIAYAEAFIEQWTEKLERRYRDRMYNFNRAKIAYASKRYADALPLLQQANYHDPLLNLGARTLLLKIYYELGEREVLQSHLDAFSSYLRRKPGISYHRVNYRNLIRFTRQLLKIDFTSSERQAKFRHQILAETTLTEKEWLLRQLS